MVAASGGAKRNKDGLAAVFVAMRICEPTTHSTQSKSLTKTTSIVQMTPRESITTS